MSCLAANFEVRKLNSLKYSFALLALAFALPVFAQTPAQALPQDSSGVYAIKGAKIFTLAGAPIDNGVVVIRSGKIAAVGADVAIPEGAKVIDATGLQVYPGMFDPVTQVGLEEVSAVNATIDTTETGEFNPDVTAATAFNADSAHVPVTRAAGITEVLTVPGRLGGFGGGGGSVIGGEASAVNLGGWNINDMVISRHAGMELTWPSIQTGSFDFSTFTFTQRPYAEAKKDYEKKIYQLDDLFDAARHYAEAKEKGNPDNFQRDLKLDALAPVVEGKEPLLVVAFQARDIREAVEFCEKQKVRMILAGASEAWKTIDLLKKDNIPVIIGPVLTMPQSEDDPVRFRIRYAGPALRRRNQDRVRQLQHFVFAPLAAVRGHIGRLRFAARRSAEGRHVQRRANARARRSARHNRAGQNRQPRRHRWRPARTAHSGEVPVHPGPANQPRQQTARTLRALQPASQTRLAAVARCRYTTLSSRTRSRLLRTV